LTGRLGVAGDLGTEEFCVTADWINSKSRGIGMNLKNCTGHLFGMKKPRPYPDAVLKQWLTGGPRGQPAT